MSSTRIAAWYGIGRARRIAPPAPAIMGRHDQVACERRLEAAAEGPWFQLGIGVEHPQRGGELDRDHLILGV